MSSHLALLRHGFMNCMFPTDETLDAVSCAPGTLPAEASHDGLDITQDIARVKTAALVGLALILAVVAAIQVLGPRGKDWRLPGAPMRSAQDMHALQLQFGGDPYEVSVVRAINRYQRRHQATELLAS